MSRSRFACIAVAFVATLMAIVSPLLIAHAGGGDSYFFREEEGRFAGWPNNYIRFSSQTLKPATAYIYLGYLERSAEVHPLALVPNVDQRQDIELTRGWTLARQTVIPTYGITYTTIWEPMRCGGTFPRVTLEQKPEKGFSIIWDGGSNQFSSTDFGISWKAGGSDTSHDRSGSFLIQLRPDAISRIPCGSITWVAQTR